ncbi:hypothetical protein [Streptomyces sp. TR06-5]|uniref:hypothetical protein n=1 Tax=Streptomyces sp. TR06-5 TaxID=3385976 RepID=UPI0039A36448
MDANLPATFLATVPQQAPTGIEVQLGAGAVALGLIVWAVAMIKNKKWDKGPVIIGFAIGTVLAGASGLLGMPGEITNSLIASVGQAIGSV